MENELRIRTIKPSFFLDEELADLGPLARILFIGLWCAADGRGRLADRPRRLAAQILPYDADSDVDALLDELADAGKIVRYEVDGERVISVPGFDDHQRITGKEADTPSKHPPPCAGVKPEGNNGETTGKQRGNNGETVNVQEGKGREGKGKEERDASRPPMRRDPEDPDPVASPVALEIYREILGPVGWSAKKHLTTGQDYSLRRATSMLAGAESDITPAMFAEAMKAIARAKWLQRHRKKGFDWILREDRIRKALDGALDDYDPAPSSPPVDEATAAEIEAIVGGDA